MPFQSDFIYVLFVAIVIVLIFTVAYKFWKGKPKDEIEKTLIDMKIMIFTLGFLLVVLMLMLPYPSFLSPSKLPEMIGDTQSNEELLLYVENLGLAFDRTRSILYFFFLFFITGLLGSFYQIIKLLSSLRKNDDPESSMDLE